MANPGHREGQAILIAAFGNEVEIVVSVENAFGPASVTRIGVEDAATHIFGLSITLVEILISPLA
jgi:hypothetical protein